TTGACPRVKHLVLSSSTSEVIFAAQRRTAAVQSAFLVVACGAADRGSAWLLGRPTALPIIPSAA
ncbi:MAG TPA: hypothetical protein VK356_08910, partial [Thermomicrobiales bacterium]|nr:hypothetical protein [Thermomicrobiales bacterium]